MAERIEARTIGQRIAEERDALGMSQTLLARLAELDRDKLNKVEHGRRNVTADESARIARVLGVSTDHLTGVASPTYFRDRLNSPEADEAVAIFERYIENWQILERLRDFGAD